MPARSDRQSFRQQIVNTFGLDELETLCHDLSVDPDLIPGKDQGKEYWADQIITYVERRQQVPDLLAVLRHARPNVAWAYQPSTVELPEPRQLQVPIAAWVGIGMLAVLLVIGAFALLRPTAPAPTPTSVSTQVPATIQVIQPATGAAPIPTLVATTTASASATAAATASTATPTSGPQPTATQASQRMSPLSYNIFIANFGQIRAGQVITLPEWQTFSESFVDSLKLELKDSSVLSAAVQSDLLPQVWSSQDAKAHGWPSEQIGALANISDAQHVGDLLGAQLVIYGNMTLSATVGRLDVGYYIPQAINTADELAGTYSLGSPVSTTWPASDEDLRALRLALNARQRLMSRIAIGLAYDVLGKQDQALTIFQAAADDLKPKCGAGREVLYFFVGRENLLLNQSAAAEQAHQVAHDCNSGYTRALIGLGDVTFQKASAIPSAERLQSAALKRTYDYYTQAEQSALATPDMPQLITLARLGLGLTKQLEGTTHYDLNHNAQAKPLLADAIRLIEPALNEMSQRPGGQKRTLAISYSRLAKAYWYSAVLTPEHDPDTVKSYYISAEANYNKCIALVPPGAEILDPLLNDVFVKTCRDNLEKMQATRP